MHGRYTGHTYHSVESSSKLRPSAVPTCTTQAMCALLMRTTGLVEIVNITRLSLCRGCRCHARAEYVLYIESSRLVSSSCHPLILHSGMRKPHLKHTQTTPSNIQPEAYYSRIMLSVNATKPVPIF